MFDAMMIILAVSGVGFALGLCGAGVLGIVNWLAQRNNSNGSFKT